jgi:hypothetical protein
MKTFSYKIIFIFLLFISLNSCEFIKRQAMLADERRQRYTVELNSPQVPIGEIQAQFNNQFPLPGVRSLDILVIYYPYEDAVCLNYRFNSITYHQFIHKEGRDAFVKALGQYNLDFENRKLREGRNHRTKSQYGTIKECYLYWQQWTILTQYSGNMDMELGYYFRDSSPFFAITQLQAFYRSPTLDASRNNTSAEIPIFFSRAQAAELAALFDQELLQSVSPIRQRTPAGVIPERY